MTTPVMRWIDYWIGIPLCAALSFWQALVSGLVRPRRLTPRRILFIELSEMGSAVLAYSALVRARDLFKDSQLYFLIFEKNRESVELLGVLPNGHILTIRDDSFPAFLSSALLALRQIRQLRIDTTIDLELFTRLTALVSYLSGAANRVGFDRHTNEGLYRGTLFTHRVIYNPYSHMSLNFVALVLALNAPLDEQPLLKADIRAQLVPLPRCAVAEEARQRIEELLTASQPGLTPQSPLVVLNPDPGVALPIRGWPLEHFVELAHALLHEVPTLYLVVTGVARSKPFADAIQRAVGTDRCLDLTGKTPSFQELLALYQRARVLVTNDSGPAHLASLTGVHIVVLFGPETPALYRPLGDNVTALYASYACSPCLTAANHRRTSCTDNRCLQAIAVESVKWAVCRELGVAEEAAQR